MERLEGQNLRVTPGKVFLLIYVPCWYTSL